MYSDIRQRQHITVRVITTESVNTEAARFIAAGAKVRARLTSLSNQEPGKITASDQQKIVDTIQSSTERLIIITHDTATICETGRALKKAFPRSDKTIILVGARRPFDEYGSDAPQQLDFALQALRVRRPGVYIAMDNRLWDPTRTKLVFDAARGWKVEAIPSPTHAIADLVTPCIRDAAGGRGVEGHEAIDGKASSWRAGVGGLPPLQLRIDQSKYKDTIASFSIDLRSWLKVAAPSLTFGEYDQVANAELNFLKAVLPNLVRWSKENSPRVLWDLDGTLLSDSTILTRGCCVRRSFVYMRPSSELALRWANRHLHTLEHGLMTKRDAGTTFLGDSIISGTLGQSRPYFVDECLYSIWPALERIRSGEGKELFESVGIALPEQDFFKNNRLQAGVIARVVATRALRAQGKNVKVVDNSFSECFSDRTKRGQAASAQFRAWLREMLQDNFVESPWWSPADLPRLVVERALSRRYNPQDCNGKPE